jgi:Ca2+-binding EF-hand superfamily protein
VSDQVAAARKAARMLTGELRAIFVENQVDLGTAFELFDTDGDGIITTAEFTAGLEKLSLVRV